jgi:hypothetical protein
MLTKPADIQPGDVIWTGGSWVTVTAAPAKQQNRRATSHRGVYYRIEYRYEGGQPGDHLYSANDKIEVRQS